MEYLFDDLKGLLIGAKKECNKRLKSLEDMVNNIISWDYTETSTIEKIFDELLEIGMLCDVKETYEKLLNYFKNIDYDGYEFYKNEYISQYESDLEESYSL
ncbi:MAG: hypothetical protein PUH53_03910 [Mycoplasma sp.]|nr:hypothetical protein [Mycoplasma sp.]MDY4544759.1 hypothetical protein [Bacilli bacterium]MDY4619244.1 hypothetical protein [Bacilli bacterium]